MKLGALIEGIMFTYGFGDIPAAGHAAREGDKIVRAERNVSAKEIGREMSVNDEFWKSARPSSRRWCAAHT